MTMKLSIFVWMLFLAGRAFGDQITVDSSGTDQVVKLNGVWGGAAEEIYTILDLAGTPSASHTEGNVLLGKDLTASVQHFVPYVYFGTTIQIGSDSAAQVTAQDAKGASTQIVVSGAAAQELYQDMQKAGVVHHAGVDTSAYVGANLSCLAMFSGHEHYSCTIQGQ